MFHSLNSQNFGNSSGFGNAMDQFLNPGAVPLQSAGGPNSPSYLDTISQFGSPFENKDSFNWGLNPETFGAVGQGLKGLTSLAQIYGMFQSLGLQKKAFRFGQEGTKRNFNAAATGFNNEITRRENLAGAYIAENPRGDYSSIQSYGKVDKWT